MLGTGFLQTLFSISGHDYKYKDGRNLACANQWFSLKSVNNLPSLNAQKMLFNQVI